VVCEQGSAKQSDGRESVAFKISAQHAVGLGKKKWVIGVKYFWTSGLLDLTFLQLLRKFTDFIVVFTKSR
jgi:hypothetical protein